MLALLLEQPRTREDWNRWSLHHKQSHDAIRSAITTQKNVNLPSYLIDPITLVDPKQWLLWNQQMHTDFNNTLQKPGVDLEELDFNNDHQVRAWVYLHWFEHNVAENTLGIGS